MPAELTDEALDYLLARSGLSLTADQKQELRVAYGTLVQMTANVRKPRGRMAEPVLTYGFAEEDL